MIMWAKHSSRKKLPFTCLSLGAFSTAQCAHIVERLALRVAAKWIQARADGTMLAHALSLLA